MLRQTFQPLRSTRRPGPPDESRLEPPADARVPISSETAEKSGAESGGPFHGNRFASIVARRPGERPHGRRVSASTGSRPTKSTSPAVSSNSGTLRNRRSRPTRRALWSPPRRRLRVCLVAIARSAVACHRSALPLIAQGSGERDCVWRIALGRSPCRSVACGSTEQRALQQPTARARSGPTSLSDLNAGPADVVATALDQPADAIAADEI